MRSDSSFPPLQFQSFERASSLLTSSGASEFTSKSIYVFTLVYIDFMEYIAISDLQCRTVRSCHDTKVCKSQFCNECLDSGASDADQVKHSG